MSKSVSVLALFTALTLVLPFSAAVVSVTRHITPNGHEFSYFPMEDAKRTAIAVTWKSGLPPGSNLHEALPRIGISLMLKGGAGGFAPSEIKADFEDLDSGSRLWARPGEIKGFIVVPDNHIMSAAHIAGLVLSRPNLEKRWLEREKRNIIKDAKARNATAVGKAWQLAREIVFNDHPYKRFWSLSPTNAVREIELDAVSDWHRAAFGTARLTIAVAGSGGARQAAKAIDAALSGLPRTNTPEPLSFDGPDIRPGIVVLHQPDLPKSLVMTLGKLPPVTTGNQAVFDTATHVLGFGKQSRLFHALRTELRAAYGFGAVMDDYTRNHRVLRMGGEVETAQLPQVLDTLRATYDEFRMSGIHADEFPVAQRAHRQRMEQRLTRPASVANMLVESTLNNQPQELQSLIARINGLDRLAVNRIIRDTYPPYDDLLKIIVTPDANAIKGACVIAAIEDWHRCFPPAEAD